MPMCVALKSQPGKLNYASAGCDFSSFTYSARLLTGRLPGAAIA